MLRTAISRTLLFASLAMSAAACSGGGDGGGTTQPGPAANVGVSSTAFTFVAIGASQAVTASVSDAQGSAVNNASIAWSSDDPSVAEVTASGRSATIVARRVAARRFAPAPDRLLPPSVFWYSASNPSRYRPPQQRCEPALSKPSQPTSQPIPAFRVR